MNDSQNPDLTPQQGGQSSGRPVPHAPTPSNVADVARTQINQIYSDSGPAQAQGAEGAPYNQTHQDNFDWRQYHSAWQEYYQEYYRRYYHDQQPPTQEPTAQNEPQPTKIKSLQNDIKAKVKDRAQAFKQSNHFWPVMSAAIVGCLFLFLQFNSILVAQVRAYVSPGELEGKNLVVTDPSTNVTVGPEPRLIIPKINVDMPIDYGVTALDDATVQVALRNAAVHYKLPGADSLPGQFGNVAILGHSSNDAFAPGSQKFAFVMIDHLEPGDTYHLHYNGTRYTYKVTGKEVINPDQVAKLQLGFDKPLSTLITCTPPGTALKRLLVYSEQINPDPLAATKPVESTTAGDQPELPGNSPTLLQQLWDAIF